MNIKKILLVAFIVASLAQIAAPLYMVYGKERVTIEGIEFKFNCAPRDPHDPFRGKYVALNFDAQTYNKKISGSTENSLYNAVAYAVIGTDEKGFAKITDIVLTQPANNTNYIKVLVYQSEYDDHNFHVNVTFPFNEYYMNEEKAPLAEKAYWNNQAKAYVTVRVLNGEAVMTGLYIDGVPVEKYIETHQKR